MKIEVHLADSILSWLVLSCLGSACWYYLHDVHNADIVKQKGTSESSDGFVESCVWVTPPEFQTVLSIDLHFIQVPTWGKNCPQRSPVWEWLPFYILTSNCFIWDNNIQFVPIFCT